MFIISHGNKRGNIGVDLEYREEGQSRSCHNSHISGKQSESRFGKFYLSASGMIIRAVARDVYKSRFGSRIGSKRGEIKEYTPRSRRRFMERVFSVDWRKIPKERIFFVRLSYHSIPKDGREVKRHLDNFRKAMDEYFGDYGFVWKMEFQQRGAVHFHLILIINSVPKEWGNIEVGSTIFLVRLRSFVDKVWNRVTGEDELHLRYGCRVERARSKNGVISYTLAYAGKFGEGKEYQHKVPEGTVGWGRFWGIVHREVFAVEWETIKVPEEVFHMARRVMIGYFRSRGRKFRVFHRYSGLWLIVADARAFLDRLDGYLWDRYIYHRGAHINRTRGNGGTL